MKEISNFIGGLMTMFAVGAVLYGVITEGSTTAIIVTIIIGLIVFFLASREESPQEPKIPKKQYQKKEVEYDDLGSCHNCNGLGRYYYCDVCFDAASFTGYTEHYEGDLYCANCEKDGKDEKNIREEMCGYCAGTGNDK